MDALVMCGGRGTRLDADVEKPLYEVAGVPMVDRVVDALSASRVDDVTAVTAPHAHATRDHLRERGVETFDADGEGYVADLRQALDAHPGRPVLTVVADLPLLAPGAVNRVVGAHEAGALTVCVPTALKDALDVSADTTRAHAGTELAPTGLNVVGEARSASESSSSEGRSASLGPCERCAAERSEAARRANGVSRERASGPRADGERERDATDESVSDGRAGDAREPSDPRDAEADETLHVTWDARLAVNVNYAADAAVAEVLARGP
jgi:adenosylcobinamide-phosphate guanylyltransferase